MKMVISIILLCAALGLAGCGDDSSSGETASGEKGASPTADVERSKPTVEVPKGPPPKRVLVKVLKEGSGPPTGDGDELVVHYVGIIYKTGEEFDSRWRRGDTYNWKLGSGTALGAFETGLKGMRVGGRRELIVPSKLAYNRGALIYVVDLLAIN